MFNEVWELKYRLQHLQVLPFSAARADLKSAPATIFTPLPESERLGIVFSSFPPPPLSFSSPLDSPPSSLIEVAGGGRFGNKRQGVFRFMGTVFGRSAQEAFKGTAALGMCIRSVHHAMATLGLLCSICAILLASMKFPIHVRNASSEAVAAVAKSIRRASESIAPSSMAALGRPAHTSVAVCSSRSTSCTFSQSLDASAARGPVPTMDALIVLSPRSIPTFVPWCFAHSARSFFRVRFHGSGRTAARNNAPKLSRATPMWFTVMRMGFEGCVWYLCRRTLRN